MCVCIYIYTHIYVYAYVYGQIAIYKGRFIIGIGSHGYGGQEVPQNAFRSQRTRKGSGVIQSESEGLRTEGVEGLTPSQRLKS